MKRVINFTNKDGKTLRGIFHSPNIKNENNKKEIFIFPNGGIMGCEGDFRAHVRIAMRLSAAGYYVFRFSPSGTGNSDGFIPDCRKKDLFNQIELGLFVSDMIAAIKYIKSISKFDSIALTGICGGAITSLLSAAELKEVTHVIPIGVPVYLDSAQNDYSKRISVQQAEITLLDYFNRLISLKSWLRILTLKTDFGTIKNALFRVAKNKIDKFLNRELDDYFPGNPKFFSAAKSILRKQIKVLFIFGGNDNFWIEFKKHYLDKYFTNTNPPFDYYLVPGGNHMLTIVEMQNDAVDTIIRWMREDASC